MSERTVWIVRLVGIIVFLVMMYLLLSLHARLVKMNEEAGKGKPIADCGLRNAKCGVGLDFVWRADQPAIRNPRIRNSPGYDARDISCRDFS